MKTRTLVRAIVGHGYEFEYVETDAKTGEIKRYTQVVELIKTNVRSKTGPKTEEWINGYGWAFKEENDYGK